MATHVGGYLHQQVNKSETKVTLGLSVEHSDLSKSVSSSRDVLLSAGEEPPIPRVVSKDFSDPRRFYVDYRSMSRLNDTTADGRLGGLYLNSKADTSIDAGATIDVRAGESVQIRSKEGISLSSSSNIKADSADSIVQSAAKSVITAAGDVMVFKCGQAHLVLRKNGDIELVGREIKINGRNIWLN